MQDVITIVVGVGAVAIQLSLFVLLILWGISEKYFNLCMAFISRHALMLGALLGALVVFGSLYFSNIVGYPVCMLCYWQRIALYPIAIIFAVAWCRGDRKIFAYILPFLILGIGASIYHELLQLGHGSAPCVAEGLGDCTKVYLNIFEYITFPVLSLTALAGFSLLAWQTRK